MLNRALYSYVVAFVSFWLGGFCIWLTLREGAELYYFKALRSSELDVVMLWITRLSEEWMYIVLVLGLLFFDRWKSLFVGLSGLTSMLFSALLKGYFELPRPRIWLSVRHKLEEFDTIPGHYIHDGFNSFPSGHTMSAFLLATTLSMLFPKGRFFFLVLAILVGLSRIYLVQHFLEDVLFGSILGVVLSIGLSYFIQYLKSRFEPQSE